MILHSTKGESMVRQPPGSELTLRSEASTRSVTASIYDYEMEHGRTYHAVCGLLHLLVFVEAQCLLKRRSFMDVLTPSPTYLNYLAHTTAQAHLCT